MCFEVVIEGKKRINIINVLCKGVVESRGNAAKLSQVLKEDIDLWSMLS